MAANVRVDTNGSEQESVQGLKGRGGSTSLSISIGNESSMDQWTRFETFVGLQEMEKANMSQSDGNARGWLGGTARMGDLVQRRCSRSKSEMHTGPGRTWATVGTEASTLPQ